MRRDGISGLLLPGLMLTLLAVAGVALMLTAGAPVVSRHVPGFPVNAADERRSVHVPPSPDGRPTSAAPARPGSPVASGTATSPGGSGGSSGSVPGARPTRAAGAVKASPKRPAMPPAPRADRSDTPTTPATTSPAPTTKACRAGSATLVATADAYVDQNAAGDSFGSEPNLLVTSRDRDRNRRALVRFALPSIPSGCSLASATLTLTAKEASGRRLLVTRAGRAWNESVTWNSAPGASGAAIGATVGSARVSWGVTSLVAAMRTSGNYGFLLRDASEGARGAGEQTNLSARSGNAAPTLTVRWS